jgi:hypothetical protein
VAIFLNQKIKRGKRQRGNDTTSSDNFRNHTRNNRNAADKLLDAPYGVFQIARVTESAAFV